MVRDRTIAVKLLGPAHFSWGATGMTSVLSDRIPSETSIGARTDDEVTFAYIIVWHS
jgi:hypothetical protein